MVCSPDSILLVSVLSISSATVSRYVPQPVSRTPLCQDQVRHQGQPLLVELEG
jgi:hypothetical protein